MLPLLCNLMRPFVREARRQADEKRVVVLFGAGASSDYGAPSTRALTEAVDREVMADGLMQYTGGDVAFQTIKNALQNYLQRPGVVNFEHIYHCVHELMVFAFPPTAGAFDEFRPLLYPFTVELDIKRDTLRELAQKIVKVIFIEVSAACDRHPISLAPLGNFIQALRDDYITRIYTTNYDDFPLQAVPDLYTGFDSLRRAAP
jgi:hypothetical protein